MASRRDVLKGTLATAAAAVAPALPALAEPLAPIPVEVPPPVNLGWMYETGDYGHVVFAPNAQKALDQMIYEAFDCDLADDCPRRTYGSEVVCTAEDCGCGEYGVPAIERVKSFDKAAARGGEPTIEDFYRAGWGYQCSRCDYDPSSGDWYPINGKAVCQDCMEYGDWLTRDPEYAAELLDEMLTDEYGPEVV